MLEYFFKNYDICSICKKKQILIKLSNCEHKFCKKCILDWYYLDDRCPLCFTKFTLSYKIAKYKNCLIKYNGIKFKNKNIKLHIIKYLRQWHLATCVYNRHFFIFRIIDLNSEEYISLGLSNYNDKKIIYMKCRNCNKYQIINLI